MPQVTMRQMLEAGVHFGHQTRYWNPKMGPYIFGARGKIHIINSEERRCRRRDELHTNRQKSGIVLFPRTKRSARETMKGRSHPQRQPYRTQRWMGGHLTNFATVKKRWRDEGTGSRRNRLHLEKWSSTKCWACARAESCSLRWAHKEMNFCRRVFVRHGHEDIAIKEARTRHPGDRGGRSNTIRPCRLSDPGQRRSHRALPRMRARCDAVRKARPPLPFRLVREKFVEWSRRQAGQQGTARRARPRRRRPAAKVGQREAEVAENEAATRKPPRITAHAARQAWRCIITAGPDPPCS